jgi:hypothetical protein
MNVFDLNTIMDYKKTAITIGLLLCFISATAQFRLPSFDIAVKAGFLSMSDDRHTSNGNHYNFTYESITWQAEANLHLGQRLAIGWFYNKKLYGNYHGDSDNDGTAASDRDASHLMYGINLRLSGGRAPKFRPYVQVKYYWLETVVQYPGYRVAADMNGVAAGVGVMLRVSNKLYINLIEGELSMITKNEKVLFADSNLFAQLRAGLTYNFSKRK